ncbi:MAG: hypothetical protein JWN57_1874, partial [Frankiales bacterium]|nr:hypothetical protein [Frankiales bacterium]
AGGLAVLAALWGLLWLHGVATPEAYTLPAAALALLAGGAARWGRPATDSVPAYVPGLVLAFAPTLLLSVEHPSLHTARLLMALPAAVAVVLAGAALRLRGPLLAGATALVGAALLLLAPVADALPRWVSLGLAGALLLGLGVTYEARRRDLELVRERLTRLG